MYTIPFETQSDTGLVVRQTTRNVVTWRTPAHGYVVMYIGPQSIRISEGKILTSTRTKAGYVMQYAGEELTKISIGGTTGSSGIEGINVLDSIYRSEHSGFKNFASTLDSAVALKQMNGALDNFVIGSANSISPQFGAIIGQTVNIQESLNAFTQPTPTLAALAASIELSFQGVTYRGFFQNFSYDETGDSPGLFNYNIEFISYAKMGSRRNFMPWHRRGDRLSDSNDSSLLTFGDTESPQQTATPVPTPTSVPVPAVFVGSIRSVEDLIGAGRDMIGFINVNLEDTDND